MTARGCIAGVTDAAPHRRARNGGTRDLSQLSVAGRQGRGHSVLHPHRAVRATVRPMMLGPSCLLPARRRRCGPLCLDVSAWAATVAVATTVTAVVAVLGQLPGKGVGQSLSWVQQSVADRLNDPDFAAADILGNSVIYLKLTITTPNLTATMAGMRWCGTPPWPCQSLPHPESLVSVGDPGAPRATTKGRFDQVHGTVVTVGGGEKTKSASAGTRLAARLPRALTLLRPPPSPPPPPRGRTVAVVLRRGAVGAAVVVRVAVATAEAAVVVVVVVMAATAAVVGAPPTWRRTHRILLLPTCYRMRFLETGPLRANTSASGSNSLRQSWRGRAGDVPQGM